MSEKTVAYVADKALDKASDLIANAADKSVDIFDASKHIIGDAIDKYGQQAIDAVLWVVRIDCAQTLVSSFLVFVLLMLSLYFVYTGFTKRDWNDRIIKSSEGFLFVPIIIYLFVMLFTIPPRFAEITNMWSYVCVAKPELYLVKQTIDVVKEKATQPTKK